MPKLRLVSLLVALIPAVAHSEPAPPSTDDIEIDDGECSDQACAAAKFADALTLAPPVGHEQRMASVVAFEAGRVRVYSKQREKLMAIAAAWHDHGGWATITVEGYAGTADLAQRRADKISSYLVRYGVPAGYVVAIVHDDPHGQTHYDRGAAGHVDLAIALCDRAADSCQRKPVQASNAAKK